MENIMKYKGYTAIVGYSTEDEVFHGRIEHINDLVTFEGISVSELKAAFEEAVEDYLAQCKAMGKNPDKPYSGVFNVRLNPSVHKMVVQMSAEKGITLNKLVSEAVTEYIKRGYHQPE
jgi:predicted HicB family RNase H-like nuclease